MKTRCPISGIEYFSSSFFKEEPTFLDPHPFFRLPARTLLSKARKYGRGEYSFQEQKLLFLALLNATEAVVWEVPADPDIQIIAHNMEAVFKLLAWYDAVSNPSSLKLPTLRVTTQNSNLSNINIFIQTWYSIRQEWMSHSSRKHLQDLLETREIRLSKLIHSDRSTDKYAGVLIKWALDASGVVDNPERRKIWTEIFTTKLDASAFSVDRDELLDMRDYMMKELYAVSGAGHSSGIGGNAAALVLRHIEKLVNLRDGGMMALLGETSGGISNTFKLQIDASESDGEKEEQEILEKLSLSNSPNVEPKREDFGGKLSDYIRAKAAWVLSASLREELEYVRNKRSRSMIDAKIEELKNKTGAGGNSGRSFFLMSEEVETGVTEND